MRRIVSTALAVVAVAAGIVAGGVSATPAPSADVALLGDPSPIDSSPSDPSPIDPSPSDPWEPDPFPLGVCLNGPELGHEPVCVLVDPEDG